MTAETAFSQTHGRSDRLPEPGPAGAAAAAPVLETRQLSRIEAGHVFVDGISVAIERAEVLAVAGPSGAGKSSFLRLLNRLDEPTEGSVLLHGQDYRSLAARELRRRVGMVMQRPYLFSGTVAANIGFGPRQRGETMPDSAVAALLARLGLPGYEQRDVASLSGGEAQRVSLARTLANAPDVLLLDEPTSALDHASARAIEELVLGIIDERRIACVIVTHDLAQAARLAPRTLILKSGRVAALGPTAEVLGHA